MEKAKLDEYEDVLRAIKNNKAIFIGETEHIRGFFYYFYEYKGKTYSILGTISRKVFLHDSTLEEVTINKTDLDIK